MDDMFQDFYALENTNGYTAANILSGFWISEKKAFENLVTTREQDAHEFFQFLAEELHERNGDGKRPEIGSEHSCNCIIHQTFYVLFRSQLGPGYFDAAKGQENWAKSTSFDIE
ncbi:Ubiquitin carboxyl-terminal hydrolase 22 [Metarhizium anisopliae]